MLNWRENIQFLQRQRPDVVLDLSDDPTVSELQHAAEQFSVSLENLLFHNLHATALSWDQVKFVFLDVDGVLTEGGMFYTESNDEFKRFDTKDGMGIKLAMKGGYQFGIISSGVNEAIIEHRAKMFGIEHVYVGTLPKLEVATEWLEKLGLTWSQCAYIGDDVNDMGMFERVGIAACPADATPAIKEQAHLVLQSLGGHGCVRELVQYLPNCHKTP